MTLSRLTNASAGIVADTSTIINLNASGCAEDVLRALPNRLFLTEAVISELRIDSRTGRDDANFVQSLLRADLASVTPLTDLQERYFSELVAGPTTETLDDGEAATIACAMENGDVAIIDDRKAIALCARKFPNLALASTVDIFTHEAVAQVLGTEKLADAVYSALQKARMRVLPQHENWTVNLIGTSRARTCASLRGVIRK